MPLNAKQCHERRRSASPPVPPITTGPTLNPFFSLPEVPHLVVHQLVRSLTETAAGKRCSQTVDWASDLPLRLSPCADLQTRVRGKDVNSTIRTLNASALCKRHHYPCRECDMEMRQTVTRSSPGGADGQSGLRSEQRGDVVKAMIP